jgi:hypothetical protein
MTATLIILGLVVLLVMLALAFFAGRNSVGATGTPTPPSANAVANVDTAEDAEEAARLAGDKATEKADEVLHVASDDDVRSRVERLRARGRAGE